MKKHEVLRRKAILFGDVGQGIEELDNLIEEYEPAGKVPISGFYFDIRFVRKLSQVMHDILEDKNVNYHEVAELINSQLLAASNYWRRIRFDVRSMYLE